MNLTQDYISQKLKDSRKNAADSDGYAEIPVKPEKRGSVGPVDLCPG
jgi:hypothetical protein